MRIPRIFLDQELTKNKTYKLDKNSFHHLLVIKKREGDKIEELRLAHVALSSILGQNSTKELLNEIFNSFCIGK